MGDERKSLGEVQERRPKWEGHAIVECNYCCFLGGLDLTTLYCRDLVLAAENSRGGHVRWATGIGQHHYAGPVEARGPVLPS